MPLTETALLRLSVVAHEAALDPTIWPQFLKQYAGTIEAPTVVLQRHDFAEHQSELRATFGLRPKSAEAYQRHYSRLNVWREQGQATYVVGHAVRDELMYPRALLKRTEFYNDYLLINGISRSLAGVIARDEDHAFVLTALRTEANTSFDAVQAKALEWLLPHLARAHFLEERLRALVAGEAALNALDYGIALLARDCRVVFCNHAAATIFRASDGLLLRNQRLGAANRTTETELQRVVGYAVSGGELINCPPPVVVARHSRRRPYVVTATPLRQSISAFVGMTTPVAMVVISDPETRRPLSTDTLKRAYGLTPKETELTLALGNGLTLQQAAEQLQMRYETARTHLRRVFSKTMTSRQSELLQLLERLSH